MATDSGSLLVTGIGELTTNDGASTPAEGVTAALVVVAGSVAWVGPETELAAEHRDLPAIDAGGGAVLPGFVDAHTHVVFAGDRGDEFARRLRGDTYEAILAAGGGIRATVRATRRADSEELEASAAGRLRHMLAAGTTTVEVKSGYGLDLATEVRMLEAVHALDAALPIDLVPTFLGAHVVPAEYDGRRSDYVALVAGEMMRAAAPLAEFCDVFCDDAAFSVDEARAIAAAAAGAGLRLRLHTEQLSHSGGAALAAELGAASADHLDHATDDDLAALAAAGTAAVLLPAVSFSLRLPYPDGRRIWDSGVTVALGTDCNPGSAFVETMPFVIALATQACGLLPEEAVWAATRGSALSLGADDRGRLAPGSAGDLVILDAPSRTHLSYRPDGNLVASVVKSGVVVA